MLQNLTIHKRGRIRPLKRKMKRILRMMLNAIKRGFKHGRIV